MQRSTKQLLAALTTTVLLASVGISSASAYTPVPLPDYADNNAGLILDSTMPSDYTISIAGGGVAPGGSMDSSYFNLENCKRATEIYCIVGAKVDGKALSFVRATEAPMLSSVGQEVSNVTAGSISVWSDGTKSYSINAAAFYGCTDCQDISVFNLNVDVRAVTEVKSVDYQPSNIDDLMARAQDGDPEATNEYRECAYVEPGVCGKIIDLTPKKISVTIRTPLQFNPLEPQPYALNGHLAGLAITDKLVGSTHEITVEGAPTKVAYFAGEVPGDNTAVDAGYMNYINPEEQANFPSLIGDGATGSNEVWQFMLHPIFSHDDMECHADLTGVIAGYATNSTDASPLEALGPWFETGGQDFIYNPAGKTTVVTAELVVRQDAGSCDLTGAAGKKVALSVAAETSSLKLKQVSSASDADWASLVFNYSPEYSDEPAVNIAKMAVVVTAKKLTCVNVKTKKTKVVTTGKCPKGFKAKK